MADFRDKIDRLQREHTKEELIDKLADQLGERVTSYNPTTEAMFRHIAPEHEPIEYARKSDDYSDDLQPVDKNALALRMLLHERVGGQPHDTGGPLTTKDFAECITAVNAYESGYNGESEDPVPTHLPKGADDIVGTAPSRTTSDPPFESIVTFEESDSRQIDTWLKANREVADHDHFVYVLDCTPDVEQEPEKIRHQRRIVKTKVESGIEVYRLDPIERAAYALNKNKQIYYVGCTNDVSKRIDEHLAGAGASGIEFTHTYRPKGLVEVKGCAVRSEAEQMEGERARRLNRRDDVFAYSDQL